MDALERARLWSEARRRDAGWVFNPTYNEGDIEAGIERGVLELKAALYGMSDTPEAAAEVQQAQAQAAMHPARYPTTHGFDWWDVPAWVDYGQGKFGESVPLLLFVLVIYAIYRALAGRLSKLNNE